MIRRRDLFSLLSAPILLASCGAREGASPDLPPSVSPGWKLASYDRSASPSALPPGGAPQCWKAVYAGQGSAQVWVCRYSAGAGAFDAVQRARTEAQTVKFQEGSYLVLVKWNDVPKADLTALVRAIQRAVQSK